MMYEVRKAVKGWDVVTPTGRSIYHSRREVDARREAAFLEAERMKPIDAKTLAQIAADMREMNENTRGQW